MIRVIFWPNDIMLLINRIFKGEGMLVLSHISNRCLQHYINHVAQSLVNIFHKFRKPSIKPVLGDACLHQQFSKREMCLPGEVPMFLGEGATTCQIILNCYCLGKKCSLIFYHCQRNFVKNVLAIQQFSYSVFLSAIQSFFLKISLF